MVDLQKKMIIAIELHDVVGIRQCFENGIRPNDRHHGNLWIDEMITMYTRTPRFSECVRLFVDFGLDFDDKVLLSILLNDSSTLEKQLDKQPDFVHKKHYLKCTYTPMDGVTLLHICAEYNHVACAEVLLKFNADINAPADTDEFGFGGQTPIFHTVNQNNNNSAEMMVFLLDHGADLDYQVQGIIWGKGYDWETLLPCVNPISYAMMGLLPQMHRSEQVINKTVLKLLEKRYGIQYPIQNVPNKYLMP
jgi:hypothetical protein